jgi:hypothetical protein
MPSDTPALGHRCIGCGIPPGPGRRRSVTSAVLRERGHARRVGRKSSAGPEAAACSPTSTAALASIRSISTPCGPGSTSFGPTHPTADRAPPDPPPGARRRPSIVTRRTGSAPPPVGPGLPPGGRYRAARYPPGTSRSPRRKCLENTLQEAVAQHQTGIGVEHTASACSPRTEDWCPPSRRSTCPPPALQAAIPGPLPPGQHRQGPIAAPARRSPGPFVVHFCSSDQETG